MSMEGPSSSTPVPRSMVSADLPPPFDTDEPPHSIYPISTRDAIFPPPSLGEFDAGCLLIDPDASDVAGVDSPDTIVMTTRTYLDFDDNEVTIVDEDMSRRVREAEGYNGDEK